MDTVTTPENYPEIPTETIAEVMQHAANAMAVGDRGVVVVDPETGKALMAVIGDELAVLANGVRRATQTS